MRTGLHKQDGTGMVLSYDKLQKFSKVILNQLKLYGGGQGERFRIELRDRPL